MKASNVVVVVVASMVMACNSTEPVDPLTDSSDACELDLTLESNEVDENTGGPVGDLKGSLCGLDVAIDVAKLD